MFKELAVRYVNTLSEGLPERAEKKRKKTREPLSYVTDPWTALTSRNIRHTTGGQRSITVMSGNDRPVTRATFRESVNQSRLMIPGKFTYSNTAYQVFDCVLCQPIHSRHRVYLH